MNDQKADDKKKPKKETKHRVKPEKLREKFVGIKFNSKEYNQIFLEMKKFDYDGISTYIREKALDKPIIEVIEKPNLELLDEIRKLFVELNKQGINLNNLTKRITGELKQDKTITQETIDQLILLFKNYDKSINEMKDKLSEINNKLFQ